MWTTSRCAFACCCLDLTTTISLSVSVIPLPPPTDTLQKVSFSLATSRGDKTDWHRIAFFDPILIKYADEHIVKGCMVMVRGHITYSKYEQDGKPVWSTEIVASRKCVFMLSLSLCL